MNEAATACDPRAGISTAEVERLRAQHGWNELPKQRMPSRIAVLFRQFRNVLVLILVVAAAIAFVLGERIDALVIVLVLALNAVLGYVQEWHAETSLDALRSMLAPVSLVRRDGVEREIPARELVPGDLVVVAAGEAVPADLLVMAGTELRADESVLTGESLPADKAAGGTDDESRLFAGTVLVAGRAEGVVEAVGLETRFGQVAELTGHLGETPTNLQRRLGQLAAQIGVASLATAALAVLVGVLVGRPFFETVMTGLSLAVAMVPEGLPTVVTVTLALGASAMARRKALVRRLQAVETLGAASVICTDKTGTLTENAMTVTRFWTPEHGYVVTGEGYDPAGHIAREERIVRAADDPVLAAALETALACSDASLVREGRNWKMIGAPTEGALVTLAYKGWAPPVPASDRLAVVPFSSERKRMAVLAETAAGRRWHVKGAPEVVLELSVSYLAEDGTRPIDAAMRDRIGAEYEAMSASGLRVLALAQSPASGDDPEEKGFVFLGLAAMLDPPRPEVASAVGLAHAAGIRVLMVTGDGPVTALAVAKQVGLEARDVIEGGELDRLSPSDLSERLRGDVLFARTRPEHKLRIVEALQEAGNIVAMTGDGVNDAPALKCADIGVAMGLRGTEVSKSAADLVLLDDNFSTIVNAIAEGRRQFDNVRKFVHYLLSSNAGEVLAIIANLAMGAPPIFLATQILWLNLVTDGATAIALGLEGSEPGHMARNPRSPDLPFLTRRSFATILAFGLYTGAASLWFFSSLLPEGEDVARTAAFTCMLVMEKVSVFAFRSMTLPVTSLGWFSNRFLILAFTLSLLLQVAAVYWAPLQTLLHTVPIAAEHWLTIGLLACPLVVLPEAMKMLLAGRADNGALRDA
jgi:Ca2+-transporting ATPase